MIPLPLSVRLLSRSVVAATLAAGFVPAAAIAAEATSWSHASAPMGQFEGGLYISENAHIGYNCGAGHAFYLTVPGDHVGPGELRIDGKVLRAIVLKPASNKKDSSFELQVSDSASREEKDGYNALLSAIEQGEKAQVAKTGAEPFYEFTLKGSRGASICKAR